MTPTILLTGATGNLGMRVMERLIPDYHVLAPVRSEKSVDPLAQFSSVEAPVLDLADAAAVKTLVQTSIKHRNLRGAVLLAGGFSPGTLQETTKEDIMKMLTINFFTAFHLVQELFPVFAQRGGGKIILVGSRGALDANAGLGAVGYALSKRLIFQLADMVNSAGKDHGIDATVIVPSTIDTLANRKAMPKADPSKWVSPQAIADTISFLLTEAGQQMRSSTLKLYHKA